MGKQPGWAQWEGEIQSLLGLDSTICSGNQWNDVGDGTDNQHDSHWPVMVDCKYTDTKASWSLKGKDVTQWLTTAAEHGKRGIMAIRIWNRGADFPNDFVVCSADDYAELVEFYREHHESGDGIVFPPGVRSVIRRGATYTLHSEDPRL